MQSPQKNSLEIKEKVLRLAELLYRRIPPKNKSQISRDTIMNSLVLVSLVAGVILLGSKYQDSQHMATLEIAPAKWTILMGHSEVDCLDKKNKSECVASPENNLLWESPMHRRDEEYSKILAADLKAPFWMGLKITPAELKRAGSLGATRLMLGLLYSRYEIWVDGERIQVGDFLENDLPLALDLTIDRMQQDKALHIAVAVFRNGKMRTIDSDWFVPTMGFYTSRASDQQIRWSAFANDTRYYVMFAVFFLFGLIFRYAAIIKEANSEYPAAAMYSLVMALLQFIICDSTFRMFGPTLYYNVLNAILVAEVFAVIGFGLAFSRAPAALLRRVNLSIPVSFLVVLSISRIFSLDGVFSEIIITYLTPLSYAAAATFCFLQYVSLNINFGNLSVNSKRKTLLASMSLIFLFMAVSFVVETLQAQAVETHWVRILGVIPLYILTTSIAAAVKRNYKIIETTSVSSFHKLTPLPDLVNGVIINLDLKSSERLFRIGAGEDMGGTIVSTVLSQMWSRFAASGATVMQSTGDDLLLIYPDSLLKEEPELWIKTLKSVHEELQLIAVQLADSQPELATMKSLDFRAAASRGAVRPLWRLIGATRVPSWVEASSKNVFVDTSRLLELERTNSSQKNYSRTVLIVDESLEVELKNIKDLQVVAVNGVGKHGRNYQGFATVIK